MLDLRPDEKADIALVKVVDAYWKATGYHGWWNGPNALTQPDQDGFQHPLLHFPKFQDHLGESLLNSGFSRNETIAHLQRWGVTSDYVAGEYIHKEELTDTGLMRVVPVAINLLTERYFGAFRRLFGYQLGMWYAPKKIEIIIGGRGSGKCLPLGTPITMADGSRKQIQSIVPGDRVATLNMDTLKMDTARVMASVRQPSRKQIYEIRLRSGRVLRASYDHPVLTPYGWKNVSDITPGDRVAQPIRIKRESAEGSLDNKYAIILALLISEGALGNNSIGFANSNPILVSAMRNAVGELFGFELMDDGTNMDYRIVDRNPVGGRNRLISWLRALGLWGTNSYQKFIPEIVFKQSDEWIATFLGYLFAGDGSAYLKKNSNGVHGTITYSSASNELITDLQDLLLVLGIHSTIRYKPVTFERRVYESWELLIPYTHDRKRFVDLIYVPTKHEKFVLCAEINGASNSSDDVYPLDLVRDYIHEKAREIGKPLSKRVGNKRPYSNMRPRYDLTRAKLQRLSDFLNGDEKLSTLANSDIYWCTVMEVTPLDDWIVYDLEVEQHHNFIASGMVVHNTDALSMIALLSEAINPGEDWLHVALIGDQANELYEKAVDYASRQAYLSNGEPCPRTFADTFFWKDGNATIISPYPRIIFEPWDDDDTGRDKNGKSLGGNTIHIRALNDERAAEKRRGKTIGRASADEVLREIEEWSTISKALGDALRGPNEYRLAKLPKDSKQKYAELTHRLRIAEERRDEKLATKISNERASFGVEKSGVIICVGNAGEPEWSWEFLDEYQDNPQEARAWAIQVAMYDNPNLTEADRKGYEDRWANDPEGRDVELLGKRPVGLGGEIAPALLITARREYDDVTVLHHSGSYGAMHLSRPAKDGWYYMIVGDMGLDRAPRRNAPCIMTWGFDPINGGMELVYFWWYWKRQNTYEQFLKEYRHCIETYPVLDSSYWCYDGGGQQKGTFEVFRSFMQLHPQGNDAPDSIFGYPMTMQNIQKESAKKMLIQALTNRWVRWPHVEIIERQPSNWNLEMDRKGGAQDVTMCLFMSVIRAWNILNDPSLVREQTDALPDGFWNPYAAIADPPTGTPLVGTPTGY